MEEKPTPPPAHWPMIAIGFAGLCWGISFIFQRVAVPEFGPLAMTWVRVTLGGLFLWACLLAKGEPLNWREHLLVFLKFGFFNHALPFSLFAFAVSRLHAGEAAVLNATVTLFGVFTTWWMLGERPSVQKFIGVAAGLAGVMVVTGVSALDRGGPWLIGAAAALGASMVYAACNSAMGAVIREFNLLRWATGNLLAASLFLAPLAWWQWPANLPSLKAWLNALGVGVVSTAIASLCHAYALRKVGAMRTMTIPFLIPFFGVLAGWAILGEPVGWHTLGGGALILLGVGLIFQGMRR